MSRNYSQFPDASPPTGTEYVTLWQAGTVVKTVLPKVAYTGQYADLSGKPTIPAAQVNADWNATSGIAAILNKPATVVTKITAGANVTVSGDGTGSVTIGAGGGGGGSLPLVVISANTTAAANTAYALTANVTLTLPASPAAGDTVRVLLMPAITTSTINPNGQSIGQVSGNMTIDLQGARFALVYINTTYGWVVT
jgi:hypothetical protein